MGKTSGLRATDMAYRALRLVSILRVVRVAILILLLTFAVG
jgi:hypothetical protein